MNVFIGHAFSAIHVNFQWLILGLDLSGSEAFKFNIFTFVSVVVVVVVVVVL